MGACELLPLFYRAFLLTHQHLEHSKFHLLNKTILDSLVSFFFYIAYHLFRFIINASFFFCSWIGKKWLAFSSLFYSFKILIKMPLFSSSAHDGYSMRIQEVVRITTTNQRIKTLEKEKNVWAEQNNTKTRIEINDSHVTNCWNGRRYVDKFEWRLNGLMKPFDVKWGWRSVRPVCKICVLFYHSLIIVIFQLN